MALSFVLNELPLPIAATIILAFVGWAAFQFLFQSQFHHETHSAYGAAHWAKKSELKAAGLFGHKGIILGRHNGKLLRHTTNKHLLTLAPNRAGKGVSSIIPNLLSWPGSLVVIDPKGENAVVDVIGQGDERLGQFRAVIHGEVRPFPSEGRRPDCQGGKEALSMIPEAHSLMDHLDSPSAPALFQRALDFVAQCIYLNLH